MGELFKSLTSGIARFVYAWLMPSVVTAGAFIVLVDRPLIEKFTKLGGATVFALVVFTLSIVFAYASRPLYQVLEGYRLPRFVADPMIKRSRRRFVRLTAMAQRGPPSERIRALERLRAYPESLELILPTRLGNALRGMETYGLSRYGLDSQTFWYELIAVARDKVREATEENRAAVDFFISSIAHLSVLSVAASVSAATLNKSHPAVSIGVALVALLAVPLAYRQAVHNVSEWRYSIQAMVNTSRPALAEALTLQIPRDFEDEKMMWEAASGLVHYGPRDSYLDVLYWQRHPSFPDRPKPEGDVSSAIDAPIV